VDGFLGWCGGGGDGVSRPGVASALGAGPAGFAKGSGANGQVLDLGEGEDAEYCDVLRTTGVC
jgi:hypothetical protein